MNLISWLKLPPHTPSKKNPTPTPCVLRQPAALHLYEKL